MDQPLKNRAFGYNKNIKLPLKLRAVFRVAGIRNLSLSAVVFLLFAASCSSGKKFSNIPQIEFKFVSPNVVKEGETGKFVNFTFHLKDGDGNIGNDPNMSPPYPSQIFLIDSRESSPGEHDTSDFTFPDNFDASQFDPKYGLEGDFTVGINGAFLLLDTLHKQSGDTFHYEVYIVDQANNVSNHVQTADVYIIP
jgi:hypothetical protein